MVHFLLTKLSTLQNRDRDSGLRELGCRDTDSDWDTTEYVNLISLLHAKAGT
jgi:hypothetical protein